MQISRFIQIVVFVTALGFSFLGYIALLGFFTLAFLILLLLYLLECAGVFRSCGSDHGLCPLDSHKPLKRLDRNFYMGALLILLGSACFVLRCCRGCFLWVRTFLGASKNKKYNTIYGFIILYG